MVPTARRTRSASRRSESNTPPLGGTFALPSIRAATEADRGIRVEAQRTLHLRASLRAAALVIHREDVTRVPEMTVDVRPCVVAEVLPLADVADHVEETGVRT